MDFCMIKVYRTQVAASFTWKGIMFLVPHTLKEKDEKTKACLKIQQETAELLQWYLEHLKTLTSISSNPCH
jgi:hypothetical protein